MSDFVVMPKKDWQDALDISRIKSATTALIKSGDLSTVIDNIQAYNIPHLKLLAGGTFTPTSDLKTITLDHNLGVVPNFCIIMSDEKIDKDFAIQDVTIVLNKFDTNACGKIYCAYHRSAATPNVLDTTKTVYVDSFNYDTSLSNVVTANSITMPEITSYEFFASGKQYSWVCGVIESTSVKTITFTINYRDLGIVHTYTVEEGTTWEDFCNAENAKKAEYDAAGEYLKGCWAFIPDGRVANNYVGSFLVMFENDSPADTVYRTDILVNGATYGTL